MKGTRGKSTAAASALLVLVMVPAVPAVSAAAAPPGKDGPMSLAEQRRAAEEAGFTIVRPPDSSEQGEALPEPSDEAKKGGAAVFVRDYNLPIYPEGRVGADELAAPAVITAARGEAEPLSLGVHALVDLDGLTLSVGPLSAPDGTALPAEAVHGRYVEAAYIRGPQGGSKTAVLTGPRVRPIERLPLARGMIRQFWIDVSVPASAPSGEYRGQILVSSEGRPEIRRELTLRVRPYVLQEPTDRCVGAFCANAIVPDRETFAEWKAHGVQGTLWFWASMPWDMEVEEGKLVCDFSATERIIDARVAAGLNGPVVIALGNDSHGFYERALCRLYDRPLAEKPSVHGRTARVGRLDDEVINRAYMEGVRQLGALVKTKTDWPEVVLLGVLWCASVAAAERNTDTPATEIGKLAASMKPGEVKELVTKNCNHDLFRMWYDWEEDDIKRYGSQKMFDVICWNNDMKWDPVTQQVLVINGGHYSSFKFITYSADRNEWTLMPVPPWMDPRRPDCTTCGRDGKDGNRSWPRTHFYDKLAISPENRLFAVNMDGLYLYHIDNAAWSPRIATSSGGKDAYQVIEYFQELKAFVYECNWGRDLRLWDVEKKEERRLGSYPFGIHGVMEYNPVHKLMLFGAGDARDRANPNLYFLNKDGQVARLKPPPVHINCTPTSKWMCDPVSGEYVGKGVRDERVFAFHPVRDQWKEIAGLRLPEGESLGVSIDTYGVMMLLVRAKGREFRCYVYKHKPVFSIE